MPRIRFQIDPRSGLSPVKEIRSQLLTFAHLGLLQHSTRLPSVRDLAAQTGLNLKTAFRIYRRLAQEQLVVIRPQAGVFVNFSPREAERSYQKERAAFLRRIQQQARQYNLSLRRLMQLLGVQENAEHGLRLRCAVLECNTEQTLLFSEELCRKLGVEAIPVSTNGPARARDRALRDADILVTTDFHWEEATRWAKQLHKELFRIRLNAEFVRLLVRHARRGLFPMILTDTSFERRFRHALSATVEPEVLERILFVHHRNEARVRWVLRQVKDAYVSPLCFDEVAKMAPARVRLITLRQMISRESLQALRRALQL